MNYKLRKIIKETIESSLLCEVKIEIDDVKKRGFASQLGQMYKAALKELKPLKIYGKIGVESAHSAEDVSTFVITLSNGDVIKAIRNTNPAFGNITVNNNKDFFITSKELFGSKFPDIIKKYYLAYKAAKSGIMI